MSNYVLRGQINSNNLQNFNFGQPNNLGSLIFPQMRPITKLIGALLTLILFEAYRGSGCQE